MNLTGITWITTYNCNIACNHCFFNTKGSKAQMNPSLLEKVFQNLGQHPKMFWQHISGGEIFLHQEKLIEIIRIIRSNFDKDIGISTNAFWAKDEDQTRKVVQELAQAGVTGIAISADYYHQEHMSLAGPKLLARIIQEEGLKTHSYIMGARLQTDVSNSEIVNRASEEIANEVKQDLDIPFALPTERSIGKGSLINIPKKEGIPQGNCTELCTCLGNRSPFNPAMVWIDPYGNVMICYGIVIGNLNEKSFDKIIEDYSPEMNELVSALADHGPKGIYNLALDKGIDVGSKFYDECDLCYTARTKLRNLYPKILTPHECYPV